MKTINLINVWDNGNPICPSNHYFEIFAAQHNQTLHQIHWNENKHSTIPSLISKKKSVGMPLSFQIIEQTYECIQDIDGKAIQTTTIMKNMNSSQSKKNHFPLFYRISKTSSDDWWIKPIKWLIFSSIQNIPLYWTVWVFPKTPFSK